MKIFVCTSRHLYNKAAPVIAALEAAGHEITLPNILMILEKKIG
jgi:hypothetical protein